MTTESPLTHDGSQCVAAANLWNPATPLYGFGGSGQYLAVFLSAPRTVSIQTTQGALCYGVLQKAPAAGQAADVGIAGITKIVAGAAITAGQELMADVNGRAVPQTATNRKIGQALESASGASVVIAMLIYTPNG